jgi:hypothetical protein
MFWSRKTIWNLSTMLMAVAILSVTGIGNAKADFIFGEPVNLGSTVNTSSHEAGILSADGLSLYLDTNRPGGHGWFDIWVTTRPSVSEPWGMPVNLGSSVNTESYDGSPSITGDGLSLFLSNGPQPHDISVSTRETTEDPWGAPVNLGPPVNSANWEWTNCISADGLELYFGSSRPGGSGNLDICVTTRATISDAWGEPANLGPTVNSSALEMSPIISADGLTLFITSERPGGYGDRDVWVTTRATKSEPWTEPVNPGPPINTSAMDQTASISTDGSVLYFSSSRSGGYGGLDIWQAPILSAARGPDLNSDGRVNVSDFCRLAQYWQQNERSVDLAPRPFADGIVDIQDVAVLAEYWLKDFRIIAHWKLDETGGTIAHDSIGENDGTVHGEPLWQPVGSRIDGALQFDGIDDYVSAGFPLGPADLSLSVFAWIKGGAPGQVIISQRDGTTSGATWLGTDPSDGKLMTELMGPFFPPLESDSVITDGQWHYVALVYDFDGFHRRLYVDGAEVAKDTDVVAGLLPDGDLYFGAGKDLDAESFFSGLIDDVRIYNQALSAEEIEELARYSTSELAPRTIVSNCLEVPQSLRLHSRCGSATPFTHSFCYGQIRCNIGIEIERRQGNQGKRKKGKDGF